MRARTGRETKNILLERGTYVAIMNEISRTRSAGLEGDFQNIRAILHQYDPRLLEKYELYFYSARTDSITFCLRERKSI